MAGYTPLPGRLVPGAADHPARGAMSAFSRTASGGQNGNELVAAVG
jgi:hypothetical protein